MYVYCLLINGTNIYAGTISKGVFLSTNNGASWTAVNNGITGAALYVYRFAINVTDIFASTDGGVYLSKNNGVSWNSIDTGLTDSMIVSLAINGDTLFAGTEQSGVWKLSISEILGVKETEGNNNITIYPNPASEVIIVSCQQSLVNSIKIYNALGEEVYSNVKPSETNEIDISKFAKGVYCVKLMMSEIERVRNLKAFEARKFIKQ